jgi:LysR family transcriptional regulator, cell division regulator
MSPFQKDLDYFMACADEGNILKASQKLDIQQSGLSKIIMRLETDLGQKLFSRSSQGIQMTSFGQNLYASLKQTKKFWVELSAKEIKQKLVLGAHPSIANTYYPKLFSELLKKYPDLLVDTDFSSSLNITRKVAELQVDVGLVINPVKNADLVAQTISTSWLGIWASQKNHTQILYYNPEMFMNQRMLKRFSEYKKIPIQDYEVIANMVKESDCVGLLPDNVAKRHGLTALSESLLTVNLCMIWHRDQSKSEPIRFILDLLKTSKF